MSHFLPQEIIRRKRDGETLSPAEIAWFVSSIVDGTIAPSQIGAFTMAVYLNGMTSAERVALTLAMRDTGSVIDWSAVGLGPRSPGRKPVFEKHSSGGVGDEKVTLLVAPLLAACGICCPNISARGLGHTGGELGSLPIP